MNTYVWSVTSMFTLPKVFDKLNCVVHIHGQLTGSNNATPPVTASIKYNVQLVVKEDELNFVPYEQITEAMAVEWAKEVLTPQSVSNLEAYVDGQIESIVNPPVTPSPQPLPCV